MIAPCAGDVVVFEGRPRVVRFAPVRRHDGEWSRPAYTLDGGDRVPRDRLLTAEIVWPAQWVDRLWEALAAVGLAAWGRGSATPIETSKLESLRGSRPHIGDTLHVRSFFCKPVFLVVDAPVGHPMARPGVVLRRSYGCCAIHDS